ncbi:MAG TPA: ribonuclease HII [Bryobacteraceae bacterium]|nr:ribonuclease HII [Bryobacteraceae bacterium]
MAVAAKRAPVACSGRFERAARARGYLHAAGVDEVGRGALFGPVYAGAVILHPDRPVRGLRDSKELTPEVREVLAERIRERALAYAIGAADVYEIDRINILQATRLAMRRAVVALQPAADYLLIDALKIEVPLPQEPLIGGDACCQAIAAASILAKTARDACMREWDRVFPEYGLARNKGYGTDEHYDALRRLGPTSLHRYSFWPVRESSQLELWSGYDNQPAEAHATA